MLAGWSHQKMMKIMMMVCWFLPSGWWNNWWSHSPRSMIRFPHMIRPQEHSWIIPHAGLFRRSLSASGFQGWVSLQWSDIFELRFFWPAKDDFACISELRAHIYRVTGGVLNRENVCFSAFARATGVWCFGEHFFAKYLWSDRESELVAVFCPIMLHYRQLLFFWNRLKIWMWCERNTV